MPTGVYNDVSQHVSHRNWFGEHEVHFGVLSIAYTEGQRRASTAQYSLQGRSVLINLKLALQLLSRGRKTVAVR